MSRSRTISSGLCASPTSPTNWPFRIDEVALAVEVVVAERLDADPVDGADVVHVGDGGRRLLDAPDVLGQAAAGGRRVEHDLGAVEAERPPPLREVPVVADVHPDLADRRLEDRVAAVTGTEVELLPEPLDLRDVLLAVLAEVGAVGVDDGRRVVVQPGLLDLVHREHEHHPELLGHRLEPLRRRPVGDRLGVPVVLGVLHLAEVRAVEQLLEAHHLCPLSGGLPGRVLVLVDHRFLVARPIGLQQGGFHGGPHAPDCNDTPECGQYRLCYRTFRSHRCNTRRDNGSTPGARRHRRWHPRAARGRPCHEAAHTATRHRHRPRDRRRDRGGWRRPQLEGHRGRHRPHDLRRSSRRRITSADGPRPRPPARRLADDRERRLAQSRRRRCDRDQGTQRHPRATTEGSRAAASLSTGDGGPRALRARSVVGHPRPGATARPRADHRPHEPPVADVELPRPSGAAGARSRAHRAVAVPTGGDDRRRRGDGRARSRRPVRAPPRRPGRRRAPHVPADARPARAARVRSDRDRRRRRGPRRRRPARCSAHRGHARSSCSRVRTTRPVSRSRPFGPRRWPSCCADSNVDHRRGRPLQRDLGRAAGQPRQMAPHPDGPHPQLLQEPRSRSSVGGSRWGGRHRVGDRQSTPPRAWLEQSDPAVRAAGTAPRPDDGRLGRPRPIDLRGAPQRWCRAC